MSHRVFPALLLVLIVALGSYLRLTHLGLNSLASDEMNHYFVGRALEVTGEPVLPSGARYERGIEYSTMVAAMLSRIDQMEIAVRFPSAMIGSLCLVVFALIAWVAAGAWPAVFSTALLAMYPEALRLSRFGRFYTLQLLAGLIAFYAGWQLIRNPLTPEGFTRRRLVRDWLWALVTIAVLAYAATVQLTTLSVAAGYCLFIAIVGIRDYRHYGRDAWRWSVPWQLTAMGIALVLLAVAIRFEMVRGLLQEARTVPMWARLSAGGPGAITSYYRSLSGEFPLVVSLSPLIFLVAIFRGPRLGGLLLAWFALPILLHSVVFPWKSERYVLLAIPALLLATGIAAAAGADALNRYLTQHLERHPVPLIPPRTAAAFLTVAIAAGAMVTTPAFNTARRSVTELESAGWSESLATIASYPALATLPIGSAQPLVALHYWGRLDFTVQQALLESWSRDSAQGNFDSPYRMKPMGSPDVYAGRPTLTTPEAIRDRFGPNGGVIIGIDQKYITFNNIEPALREVLDQDATELCQGKCGSMNLYHWDFRTPPGDPSAVPSTP